jgi:hypothetical protein
MGKTLKQTFLKRRHEKDQKVYEKVLYITNHQENANENHNVLSFHSR